MRYTRCPKKMMHAIKIIDGFDTYTFIDTILSSYYCIPRWNTIGSITFLREGFKKKYDKLGLLAEHLLTPPPFKLGPCYMA